MKAVVVGAGSGLGRCIAIGLAKRGAKVAALGRRRDRLVDTARELGEGALAVACDATDAGSCKNAIEEAAAGLGGIDSLVYSPGVGPLVPLTELDAETWRGAFDTNVLGAALVTAAALPHLAKAQGAAAYLSTVSASLTAPWPGLGAYAVTKAALDKLVEAWRSEHPNVGFTRVVVGDCAGGPGNSMTEFARGWDPQRMGAMLPIWSQRALLSGALLDVEELVKVVDTILRCGATASIPSVTITPRRPG